MDRTIIIFIFAIWSLTADILFGQEDSSRKTVDTYTAPDVQAEFPGGHGRLMDYMTENVTDKLPAMTITSDHLGKVMAKFIVNEDGNIADVAITKSSTDPEVDQLFLNAISKSHLGDPPKTQRAKK